MTLFTNAFTISKHRLALWSGVLLLCFNSTIAFSKSPVEDYIVSHGGCSLLSPSWQNEFGRPGKVPYGKPFLEWDDEDFSVLRKWVEQCLNSFSAAPGRREFAMRGFDIRVKDYRETQQRARENIRRQEELAAERAKREAEIRVLADKYEASLSKAGRAILDFDRKAAPFLEAMKHLDLADFERVLELGRETQNFRAKAEMALTEAQADQSNLARLGGAGPRLHILDRDHVFVSNFERIRQLHVKRLGCVQRLSNAGVPKGVSETKMLTFNGDQDSYLFELICPSETTIIAYSGPNTFSKLFKFELGNTPVRLT